jgi:hypothetical protein
MILNYLEMNNYSLKYTQLTSFLHRNKTKKHGRHSNNQQQNS